MSDEPHTCLFQEADRLARIRREQKEKEAAEAAGIEPQVTDKPKKKNKNPEKKKGKEKDDTLRNS